MELMANRMRPPELDLLHGPWPDAQSLLPARPADTRLQVALLVSVIVHAVVVLGVTFRAPDPRSLISNAPALEVVLVNSRRAEAPKDPQALAQANLDGGGTTEQDRRAKSPLPAIEEPTPMVRPPDPVPEAEVRQRKPEPPPPKPARKAEDPARKAEALEREARRLMTQLDKAAPAVARSEEPTPRAAETEPPRAAELMQRSLEVARLEAQIAKDWDAYQKRPRRRFVGARTREFRFARYVDDWRVKVERVGTLNYPQAARDQQIYGSLQLTVAIRADGSVERVEINRPSGHRVLDDAALRIVQLAAPFAPFPPDVARDTDILSITRTWTFTRADQFHAD